MKFKLFGKNIDMGLLREPQSAGTSATAELHRDFESHPIRGMTPQKMAELLEDSEKGNLPAQADLAIDLEERVPHLFAELSKRKRAPMSLPWRVAPPDNKPTSWETGYAEELTERLRNIEIQSWREREVDDTPDAPNIENVFFDMLDGLMHCYSCIETAWQNDGLDWTPQLWHRHPNWFVTPQINRNKLMLRKSGGGEMIEVQGISEYIQAESLRRWGWITHTHRAKSGYLTRSGLVRVVAWPALYLIYSVQDFAELLRILGVPPILASYPRNAQPAEKSALMRAVLDIGRRARGIIPEGMKVEFFQHAQLTGDHFLNMIHWAEGSISKSVIGGTLTTDSQGGTKTNALGLTHQNEFWELTKSDVTQICGTLSRDLVLPLSVLNARGRVDERRPYRFVIETQENADLKEFGEALAGLTDTGMLYSIPVSWAHKRTGIPLPADGEKTLGELLPNAPAPAPAVATRVAALRAESNERDPLENLAQDMADDWRPVMEPMIEPILKALEQVKTEAELDDTLALAAHKMNLEPQAERIFNALMLAYIYGRAVPPGEQVDASQS
jgi:phage gp29-like protein